MIKCNRKQNKITTNEKKEDIKKKADLVNIHIFGKLYQDNNDIQQHQFRFRVHSEQDPPEKNSYKTGGG